MDNRAATVLLIVGLSFVFWLHNTERLGPIVEMIKSPSGGKTTEGSSGGAVSVFSLPKDSFLPGAGFVGSVNK